MYHIPRRSQLQFYDVIFSLVIIRLLGHCIKPKPGNKQLIRTVCASADWHITAYLISADSSPRTNDSARPQAFAACCAN